MPARKHSQSNPHSRMSLPSQSMSRVSASIESQQLSLLMALPAEIMPLITVHLHPHHLHALRRLCRDAQQHLAIPPSFSFALNNMRALCAASDIRSNRNNSIFSPTLNWSSLGPVYLAAYIAVAGVSYSSLQVMGIDYEESTALDISTDAAALLSNALILAAEQDGLSRRRWNKPIVQWEMCESLVVQIAAISGWSSVLQAIASHVPGFAATHANLILDYTAQNGHSEIVAYLLQHWSAYLNLGYFGSSAFRHACANGHAEVVVAILEHAVAAGRGDANLNVKAHDNYALMKAAEHGHGDIVKILLRHCRSELDPSAFNCHALRMAVENGHSAVVQVLLDDGRCDTTELPKEHQEVLEAYMMHLAGEGRIPDVVEPLLLV
ncbi:ankyrin repeat-containing domain protein, partial [Chytriomyces cf. hyalinus JEL632]